MIDLRFEGSPKGLMDFIGSEICEDCHGEGVRYFFEMDRDGHWADTGVETCYCQLIETE